MIIEFMVRTGLPNFLNFMLAILKYSRYCEISLIFCLNCLEIILLKSFIFLINEIELLFIPSNSSFCEYKISFISLDIINYL